MDCITIMCNIQLGALPKHVSSKRRPSVKQTHKTQKGTYEQHDGVFRQPCVGQVVVQHVPSQWQALQITQLSMCLSLGTSKPYLGMCRCIQLRTERFQNWIYR